MRRHSNPLTAYGVTYQDIAHAQFDATVIREEIQIYGPGWGRRAELTEIDNAIDAQVKGDPAFDRVTPPKHRVDKP